MGSKLHRTQPRQDLQQLFWADVEVFAHSPHTIAVGTLRRSQGTQRRM